MADLSAAKIGTRIAVPKEYSSGIYVEAVTRITDTRVVCSTKAFRKRDGLLVGSGDQWNRRYGRIATDADVFSARLGSAQSLLRTVKVTEKNLELAEALINSMIDSLKE